MRVLALFLAAALATATAPAAQAQGVLVYAAASLTDALREATAAVGLSARFSFAASSILARQIENGAPADVFASADEEWADYLAARGKLVAATRTSFLSNRLVLVAGSDRALAVDLGRGAEFLALLGAGRLATGDPAHVPAGRYAKAAFERLGVWSAVEPRIARAASVRAALALVERGEAPFGVVFATDVAAAPGARVVAVFPADSHPPIAYPFAVVAGRDGPAARAFVDAMRSPPALAVFRRHGFLAD